MSKLCTVDACPALCWHYYQPSVPCVFHIVSTLLPMQCVMCVSPVLYLHYCQRSVLCMCSSANTIQYLHTGHCTGSSANTIHDLHTAHYVGSSANTIQDLHTYGTTQRQLDARTRSVGSAPKDNIRGPRYGRTGACWDFSCVEQGLPIISVNILKIPKCTIMIWVSKDMHEHVCTYVARYCSWILTLLLDVHLIV